MADLVGGGQLSGGGNGRISNGGSRTASGPVPVPQYPTSGMRTPTDIMRQRRDREARKKAESEAKQREREADEQRKAQEERRSSAERRAAAGVAGGGDISTQRRSVARRSGDEGPTRPYDAGTRSQGAVANSTNAARPDIQAGVQPTSSVTASGRVQDPAPLSQDPGGASSRVPYASSTRPRATSASQPQPKLVQPQQPRAASTNYSTQQQPPQTRQVSAAAQPSQTQANPSVGPSTSQQPQTSGATQQRNPTTSSFPHALERWETLSSHWEGLTSFWIRRLQENSRELALYPLSQQMSRQINDLSAAGANLFHAVVELQRLRASSERKFQRWFFETRAEQERAQETQAELTNTLRAERRARADVVATAARVEAEKGTSEQLVKEMRRELQISKEEARRAWEELGRREQEERDRTASLKNGEPTLVGGVQVVPMMQGVPSRQGSTMRQTNFGGAYSERSGGSATGTQVGQEEGVDSPLEGEQGHRPYPREVRSPTNTDPFIEDGRDIPAQPLHHEPDLPSLTEAMSQPSQQPPTSPPAAPAVQSVYARPVTQQPSASPQIARAPTATAPGGTYLQYSPAGASQPFYQHQGSALHAEEPPRVSEPDSRSYVQSVEDTVSDLGEEEYDIDEHGEIRRDAQGRPILYRRGLGSEDSDEYDVHEALERERAYGQRYGGVSGVEYGQGSTGTAGATLRPVGGVFAQQSVGRGQTTAGTAGAYGGGGGGPGYGGSGLGWEAVPRHHHPTRLSDVLEEDERSRTSPSRASQTSRGLH